MRDIREGRLSRPIGCTKRGAAQAQVVDSEVSKIEKIKRRRNNEAHRDEDPRAAAAGLAIARLSARR